MSSDLPGDPPQTVEPTPDPAIEQPAPPPVEQSDPSETEQAVLASMESDPVIGTPDTEAVHEPPPVTEPEPLAEPEVVAQGRVVETRGTALVLNNGTGPGERHFEVNEGHEAIPGQLVTIMSDGSVMSGEYTPEPATIALPTTPKE